MMTKLRHKDTHTRTQARPHPQRIQGRRVVALVKPPRFIAAVVVDGAPARRARGRAWVCMRVACVGVRGCACAGVRAWVCVGVRGAGRCGQGTTGCRGHQPVRCRCTCARVRARPPHTALGTGHPQRSGAHTRTFAHAHLEGVLQRPDLHARTDTHTHFKCVTFVAACVLRARPCVHIHACTMQAGAGRRPVQGAGPCTGPVRGAQAGPAPLQSRSASGRR